MFNLVYHKITNLPKREGWDGPGPPKGPARRALAGD